MFRLFAMSIGAAAVTIAAPLEAATVTATSADFKSVFAKIRAGDTIRLVGSFGRTSVADRSFTSLVTIDARAATFTDTLSFSRVKNVTLIGGRYGTLSTKPVVRIRVNNSDLLKIQAPVITNNKFGHGIDVSRSNRVTIDGGVFKSVGLGIGFTAVTNSRIINNKVINSSSDGFVVVDSHNVLVSRNSCTGSSLNPGSKAHPDCVQLWSIKGNAVQSDIEVSDNFASGATQGFTSFNASAGGGLRIKMLRNRVDTSYPQGIACYGCVDSQFAGNILTTQTGAKWRTSLNIVGGRNNIISGNSIGAFVKGAVTGLAIEGLAVTTPWDDSALTDLQVAALTDFESALELRTEVMAGGIEPATASATAVPEPAAWVMLVSGFGLAGTALRCRRRRIVET